jgi:hypothetical protein
MLTRARIAALSLVSAGFLAGSVTHATDVDLTTAGTSGTINGADFVQTSPRPSGTGVIKSFVRLQANGSERGFNTDHSPLNGELNDIKAGTWTHAVHVSDLTPIDHNGSQAIQFLLDINQIDSKSLLSLDELQVYTAPVGNLSSHAAVFSQNLIYDMGAGNRVLLDYGLNSGSGAGDMYFYLPANLLNGLGSQFIYLYSKFGASGGDYETNDGYEEWAYIAYPVAVEPRTWSSVKEMFRD